MADAISNTSPLLYLFRIGALDWLPRLFGEVWAPGAVLGEQHPQRIALLDDAQARKIARAAGLTVWGTLRVLLEGKAAGLTTTVGPCLDHLLTAGMWLSPEIRRRILVLAGE